MLLEIEIIDNLMAKGSQNFKYAEKHSGSIDAGLFGGWRIQTLNFLKEKLEDNNPYIEEFEKNIIDLDRDSIKRGLGVLNSLKEDFKSGNIAIKKARTKEISNFELVKLVCERFHLVVKQLQDRYGNRATISVEDEYDVQDLFHSLLRINFDDIRPEEWTPSYAGKCSRMDFLLPQEKIVIEIKKTRLGLGGKELGSQLIEDIGRYEKHPNCDMLICFVYDPKGIIINPRGIENDLRKSEKLSVEVFIRP